MVKTSAKETGEIDMVTALMCGAMGRLNIDVITYSFCKAGKALSEFFNDAAKKFVGELFNKTGVVHSASVNGWSLPDAVWTYICLKQPNLNSYPLGEIAERAVKKVVVSVILNKTDKLHDLSESEIKHRFALHVKEKILHSFLTHYYFEVCIDYMRRPGVLGWGYNFSKKGWMVSLEPERNLRATLEKQCNTAADKFLPFQLKALSKKNAIIAKQQIKEGLIEVFGEAPPEVVNEHTQNKNIVNVIVGTQSPSNIKRSYTLVKGAKRFLLHTKRSNVSFSFDTLKKYQSAKNDQYPENNSRSTCKEPHTLVKDLLDLGVSVYMSDLYTKRGRDLARHMGLYIPVRDPDHWLKRKNKVEQTVASLGRDEVCLHFVKLKEKHDALNKIPKPDINHKRCVCLFSGGLDSLAGAVWALDNGIEPVFVSHNAQPQLAHKQKFLVENLANIAGKNLQHFDFHIGRSRSKKARYQLGSPPRSIMAQHLRSFLFLSLATAVAIESGIREIYIFENGPIALNPLFSEARVNTHTAHPNFLAFFQDMINSIFQVNLRIMNPFIYMTKGEIADILSRSKVQVLIKDTCSCWNWFRVALIADRLKITWHKESHDGDCLPCVLRRVALHRAGLEENDALYIKDIFAYGTNEDTFNALADYLRFCQNAKTLSDRDLLLYSPDFSIFEEDIDSEELVQMYREHAEEVIQCFREKSTSKLRKVLASVLI